MHAKQFTAVLRVGLIRSTGKWMVEMVRSLAHSDMNSINLRMSGGSSAGVISLYRPSLSGHARWLQVLFSVLACSILSTLIHQALCLIAVSKQLIID